MRQADIALCVISIEELEQRHNPRIAPPKSPVSGVLGTEVMPLLTPKTLVLLNKADLAMESPMKHAQFMEGISNEILARDGKGMTNKWWWSASLATGEGMQEFVQGLVGAIAQRYGYMQ